MLLDLINLTKVRRAFICLGLVLIALALQNIVLARIELLGVKAMVLPLFPVSMGFFGGGMWGGVFGLILGFLTDLGEDGGSMLMTVLFPILGFIAGVFTTFYINKKFVSFFWVSVGALVITVICQMFPFLAFSDSSPISVLFTGLLQTLWTMPFTLIFYFPCRSIWRLDLSK